MVLSFIHFLYESRVGEFFGPIFYFGKAACAYDKIFLRVGVKVGVEVGVGFGVGILLKIVDISLV